MAQANQVVIHQERENIPVANRPERDIHEMAINYRYPLDREAADIYLRSLEALGFPVRRGPEIAGLLTFDIEERLVPEAKEETEQLCIDIFRAVRQGIGEQLRQRLDKIESSQPRRLSEPGSLFSL